MIPTISKSTRVTKKTATAIDHIIINSFVQNTFKTAIIKSDVSDHFPICIFFLQQTYLQKMMLSINIKEPLMIKKLKLFFKISINMTGIPLKPIRMQMKLTIISYQYFVQFMILFFPMNKMQIKTKDLESPWITKRIKNLLKRNNVCIQSFLKKEMKKRKKNIKITKSFLNLLRSGQRNCIFLN